MRGGTGSGPSTLEFDGTTEYITEMYYRLGTGTVGSSSGTYFFTLVFKTNKGNTVGGGSGLRVGHPCPVGQYRLAYISGISGTYLLNLVAYWQPLDSITSPVVATGFELLYNQADCSVASPPPLPSPGAMPPPPPPPNLGQGIQYTIFKGAATWTDAKIQCRSRGMVLASVTSDAIASELHSQMLTALIGTGGPTYTAYWVGGSDAAQEGIWRWEDGSTWSYSKWHTGEPNNANGKEHCLAIGFGSNPNISGRWDDATCATTLPFACGPLGEVAYSQARAHMQAPAA
jgi:hypothetical protein